MSNTIYENISLLFSPLVVYTDYNIQASTSPCITYTLQRESLQTLTETTKQTKYTLYFRIYGDSRESVESSGNALLLKCKDYVGVIGDISIDYIKILMDENDYGNDEFVRLIDVEIYTFTN